MALSQQQIDLLKHAMESYAFPAVYFNCDSKKELLGLTMAEVEPLVKQDLISGDIQCVRRGLAAVLYWGFKYAPYRTNLFLSKVKMESLERATQLFLANKAPSLIQIKALKLPQFSAISFTSKVRMFLDPENSAVLDNQILKMRKVCEGTVLDQLTLLKSGATISITKANSEAYENWCYRLREIRDHYFPQKRVVDIERAFFALIQKNRLKEAADALHDA